MPLIDPTGRYVVATLYHFTDRRNLKLIRELGGIYSLSRLNEMGVRIPAPGGNQWSHDADVAKGLDQRTPLLQGYAPNGIPSSRRRSHN